MTGSNSDTIARFFAHPPFAVVGASDDPSKFGHRVFAHYLQCGQRAHAVNPKRPEILGHASYASLAELPEPITSVSVITPPSIARQVVEEAHAADAKIVWFQPGAESSDALARAEELGIEVISGGPCVLVELSAS